METSEFVIDYKYVDANDYHYTVIGYNISLSDKDIDVMLRSVRKAFDLPIFSWTPSALLNYYGPFFKEQYLYETLGLDAVKFQDIKEGKYYPTEEEKNKIVSGFHSIGNKIIESLS